MHSLAVKIISLASLFTLTFASGIIPLKLRQRGPSDADHRQESRDRRRKQLISLCTCFAGGAFFASSMLELLPMVQREFKTVLKNANIKTDFPVPEFGVSIGFFLILIVEQIIHVLKDQPAKFRPNIGTEDASSSLVANDLRKASYGATAFRKHGEDENILERENTERESGESDDDEVKVHDHHHHHHHGHHHHSGGGLDQAPIAINQSPRTYQLQHKHDDDLNREEESDHHHDHSMMFVNTSMKHQNERHYLRSYLLLIALSIHALFEGLAVGLFQNTDSMVELLGALIIHKCILAFSIGINLVQHCFPSFMIVKSSFLFSAMSPIGLGLGILMLMYTSVGLGHIFSSIFQSIATGTFLYVTFFEIFFHELNSRECHKLLKVLMMILGFSLITVVQYFDTKVSSE